MNNVEQLSSQRSKKLIMNWLSEGRSHEEIAEKISEAMSAAIDQAMKHERERLTTKLEEVLAKQMEELLKPIELKPLFSKKDKWIFGLSISAVIVCLLLEAFNIR